MEQKDSTNQVQQNPASSQQKSGSIDKSINFMDIYSMCLHRWWWFIISVLVTLTIGVFYLLKTPKVYTRDASVMIKEDRKNSRSMMSQLSGGADLGMFSAASDVNNELVSIQSPAILVEVAKRLHIDFSYQIPGTFLNSTLYGKTLPVMVSIIGLDDEQTVNFRMKITKNGFTINKLKTKKNGTVFEHEDEINGSYNKPISTVAGQLKVVQTPYFATALSQDEMEIIVSRKNIMSALSEIKSKFSASLNDKQSAVINLTYNDVNTQRAEDVLNTIITVYNENWVKDKNQIAVSTSQFINERLKVIEQELGNVDSDISNYKSQNLVPDIAASTAMAMQQASMSNTHSRNYTNALYMVRFVKNYMSSEKNKYQLLPANTGIENGAIESLLAQYNAMLLQRNSLVANSSEDNALVIDMNSQLAELRKSIIVSLDNEATKLQTLVKSEQGNEAENTSKIAKSPVQAKNLLSVERQQKVKESLYLYLLQKREENELNQAFTAYNTRIITPPMGSNTPTSPQKMKIMMIALLAGLLIPVGIIYLRETLNTRVRGRKDIEDLTVPYVGEIPLYQTSRKTEVSKISKHKENKGIGYRIVVKKNSRTIINEAFRVTRTNLEFMLRSVEGNKKIIMVTSCNPGSGKSFLAANIANAFSMKDKKCIIIDLDLRKASLSTFANKPDKGIADYLAGAITECPIHKVEEAETLDIIPVGTIPPNPTELLFSTRLQELLDNLREKYDYIFIDCPPTDIVADTSIISDYADMTLFIIRANLLERDMLPIIQGYYDDKKFKNMAVLLNGTRGGHGRYGYHYGYGGYGYGGYGYGYGEKD